jgi:hypothetical protein
MYDVAVMDPQLKNLETLHIYLFIYEATEECNQTIDK